MPSTILEDEEDPDELRSTRMIVGELQRIQVPATSDPAIKVKNFHNEVLNIKNAKAPRVKELMDLHCPEVSYKVMDDGKAHLARTLETLYNLEPMVTMDRKVNGAEEERVVKHKFEAYQKLNTKIQERYDAIFGRPASAKPRQQEAEEEPNVAMAFGSGAIHIVD